MDGWMSVSTPSPKLDTAARINFVGVVLGCHDLLIHFLDEKDVWVEEAPRHDQAKNTELKQALNDSNNETCHRTINHQLVVVDGSHDSTDRQGDLDDKYNHIETEWHFC